MTRLGIGLDAGPGDMAPTGLSVAVPWAYGGVGRMGKRDFVEERLKRMREEEGQREVRSYRGRTQTCRNCGLRCQWSNRKQEWVHLNPGAAANLYHCKGAVPQR